VWHQHFNINKFFVNEYEFARRKYVSSDIDQYAVRRTVDNRLTVNWKTLVVHMLTLTCTKNSVVGLHILCIVSLVHLNPPIQ